MNISINQAAARGITRIRKSIWSNPLDHVRLDIIDGMPGPWLHLYAPFNKRCNGRDPVELLGILEEDYGEVVWEIYTGPLADSSEYRTACAVFDDFPEIL